VLETGSSSLAGFFVTLLAIFALRPVATAVDLVDRPGGHKTHHGDVPVVGGLAMFIGIVLGVCLLSPRLAAGGYFLAASAVLVTVGLLDDRFNLSPWARLPVQIVAALILSFGWGGLVTSFGAALGGGEVTLSGWGAHVFTVAITVAAINAFNMLDGMDGLAGALAAVAFVGLTCLAWSAGLGEAAGLGCVLFGAVAGFMVFSLPFAFNRSVRCFMGDAGSTVLGFGAAWLAIDVSQAPASPIAPVTVLWVVALPLYELFWSTLRRVLRGVSPFKGDKAHFHHLLLAAGFSVRGAFGVFLALAVLFAAIGLVTHHAGVPELYSFAGFVLAGVGVVWVMARADLLFELLPLQRDRRGVAAGQLRAAD
jgi:UDP-GlcNAc:undecaprenyl-phosphate/decaprenyl-phosphate GlcNAc-1-phosphate transferase